MSVVSMSKKEFDRLEVLLGVQSGRLRVADACKLLSLKRRQVFRLLAGLKHGGAASLVSKRRGRPSNSRLPEAYRDLALSLAGIIHHVGCRGWRERYKSLVSCMIWLLKPDQTKQRSSRPPWMRLRGFCRVCQRSAASRCKSPSTAAV